jgi:hypothetical protein
MVTECTSLLLAGIVVLSMLGINISALLLPTGVVLAIASRDLLQNFIAGTCMGASTSSSSSSRLATGVGCLRVVGGGVGVLCAHQQGGADRVQGLAVWAHNVKAKT